jgi:D-alanyl-D-alanine carboxypeptidase/D-alanyl-D-alanine endopeptidase (penicillin-binding protein 7)
MFKFLVAGALLAVSSMSWSAMSVQSTHAIVVDDETGQVLLDKNSGEAVPIASVTKLMTVMVVLDAGQDPDEVLRIERADIDSRERIRTCLPVGTALPRNTMVELALMASDNHAAAALARNYPAGMAAFDQAMKRKIAELELRSTSIDEPTGLSPGNQASAEDLVRILRAAATYPQIAVFTTQAEHSVEVKGRLRSFHNTNGLVGQPGWDILLSKTGTTAAAGRCLVMRLQSAGRTVLVVLMGAAAKGARALDALNVQRWLAGDEPIQKLARVSHRARLRPRT